MENFRTKDESLEPVSKQPISQPIHKIMTQNATYSEQQPLQVQYLPIDKLVPSPSNPRKHFDPKKQKELEASIREHGFTMSVALVRPFPAREYRIEHEEGTAMYFIMEYRGEEEWAGIETAGSEREAEATIERLRDRYEIVAGECRWRAAVAVGTVPEIPCFVRHDLSDQQVLILQLIENLQRTDLSTMEEAQGYLAVLAQRDEAGEPLYTVERLAKEIGKDRSLISKKVRLAVLEPNCEIRRALEQGVISIEHGLALAGIIDPVMRAEAAQEVLHPQHEEGPLSRARTRMLVEERYRRDLKKAGFDQSDAELSPVALDEATGERRAGGACDDCPFKVGNMKKLDPEIAKESRNEVCTNPACFEKKREADWMKWQARETNEEKKRRALSEECRKLYRYGNLDPGAGLVDLAEHPGSGDLRPGEPSPGPWKKLIKGAGVEVLVVRDQDGKQHELVSREQAHTAAVKINEVPEMRPIEPERPVTQMGGQDYAEHAESRREEIEARDLEWEKTKFLETLRLGAIVDAVQGCAVEPARLWHEVAGILAVEFPDNGLPEMGLRRGWAAEDEEFDHESIFAGMTPAAMRGVAVEMLLSDAPESELLRWAEMFSVDLKKAAKSGEKAWKEKMKAEEAEREAEALAAKMIAPGLEWERSPAEAGEFIWHEEGYCINPCALKVGLSKPKKGRVEISVAEKDGAWFGGSHIDLADQGEGWPVRLAGKARKEMLDAVLDEAYGAMEYLRKHEAPMAAIQQMSGHIQTLLALTDKAHGKVDEGLLPRLVTVAATDPIFREALAIANRGTIQAAIQKLEGMAGSKAAIKKLTSRYAALEKGGN